MCKKTSLMTIRDHLLANCVHVIIKLRTQKKNSLIGFFSTFSLAYFFFLVKYQKKKFTSRLFFHSPLTSRLVSTQYNFFSIKCFNEEISNLKQAKRRETICFKLRKGQ